LKEGEVVSLRAGLEAATLMGNGDYNLPLTATSQSRHDYVIGEIPNEDDVSDPALQKMVDTARSFLKSTVLHGHDLSRTGTVLSAPTYVEVSGPLFFNDSTNPATVSRSIRPERTAAALTAP
jgi:hypothetical protein